MGAGTVDLNGTGNVLGLIAQNVTVSGTYSATSSVAATASMSVSGSLTLGGHTVSVGTTFATTGTGTVTMTNAADQMFVAGNATFGGGNETGLLTAGTLQLSGNFSQTTSPTAFVATAPHMTTLSGTLAQTINFANPAAASSHFGNLNLSDTATVLASNVYLTGQLQATGTSFHIESAADHLITSNGANLQNVVFDNVRWATIGTAGAGLFPSITNVTFQNISATTLPQFDFEYSTKTNITLPNFTFLTTPTGGGSYISIVGPDTLTMTGVTPSNNGGLVSLTSGGMVLGWTGAATQLVISQQPTNTAAGLPISPAVVVTAKDFANNVVTTYTGSVSLAIGANPGGATLSGPPSVTAVAGVAVFNSMSLNKAGTGYTLVASASGVTSATTSAFNITAGSAATLAISGGQGQTGITSSPLATALAVTVTDAFGNPVTGTTVNWASSGGAIVTPTSSVTNSSGVATSSWTLGSTPGAQTATATSGSLTGSPATFNATATLTGFSKTWTGATSTAWTTSTNWTPSGVPVAGDSVFIPSGGNQPTISAAVTVKHLTVGFGATLTFASSPTLTVTGNFTDNGTTAGAGTVDLNGTGTVAGPIAQNVTVTGTYTASASASMAGTVSVSGSLTLGGHAMGIAGTFATTGTGTLTMNNSADVLSIVGNATFGGGSESGLLTQGNLSLSGNFAQINGTTSFIGTSGHTTTFGGSVAQTVNFANVFPSAFGAVT
ncbi:MAG TPA: Ig-like domain-containing protein, partial [Gemmatimonadaceae bacterium]|nr:Ig-like domain-containing protein [Gemmatimonadaceae bacterium]